MVVLGGFVILDSADHTVRPNLGISPRRVSLVRIDFGDLVPRTVVSAYVGYLLLRLLGLASWMVSAESFVSSAPARPVFVPALLVFIRYR